VEVYKGDRLLTELHPRTDYYYEAQQNMTIPGLLPSLTDDVYLLLVNWEPASSAGTTFKLYVNPLVNWLWIAIPIFLIGILIAVWPDKDPEYESARERARISRQTSAAD
jgi:cytochrome c-type biogenesis protein CcmF